jgi:hypothetical protein
MAKNIFELKTNFIFVILHNFIIKFYLQKKTNKIKT